MNSLVEIFRMHEISPKIRANIIVQLGLAINDQHGANLTEPLVYELVKLLDENHKILTNKYYVEKWEWATK
jgi:hypothetical protein